MAIVHIAQKRRLGTCQPLRRRAKRGMILMLAAADHRLDLALASTEGENHGKEHIIVR